MDPPLELLVNFSEDKEEAWNKYKDMPSRFKAVLILASSNPALKIENYREIMDEWEFSNESYPSSDRCICSHMITHSIFMKNKITRQVAAIGSDCIEKFGKDNQKEQLKIIVNSRNYKGDKIACCFCGENRVEARDDTGVAVPLCNSCLNDGRREPSEKYLTALGIPCSICKSEKILPNSKITCCYKCASHRCYTCDSPLFIKREEHNGHDFQLCYYCPNGSGMGKFCLECRLGLTYNWGITKGNILCLECEEELISSSHSRKVSEMKACITCHKRKIPIDEPSWKINCGLCYAKKMQVQSLVLKRACIACGEMKIPISEPKFKTKCTSCYYTA